MKQFLRRLLTLCIVCGVLGLVGILMAELNHRRYRLRTDGQQLIVERGLFLPIGFGRHQLQGDSQQPGFVDVYAPLPVPLGETFTQSPSLDDRTELDRALFDLLFSWAKPRLFESAPAQQLLAVRYVQRLEALPSLSEGQRLQLRQLRAEVAFVRAHQKLNSLVAQLREAQTDLRLAVSLGSPRTAEASATITQIDQQLELLRPLLPAAKAAATPLP